MEKVLHQLDVGYPCCMMSLSVYGRGVKVWSDFKNNTKKKAVRGTGGGPASNFRLSDLEQKVLAIVGSQAATGIINIPEIGLEEEVTEPPPETNDSPSVIIQQLNDEQDISTTVEDWNRPGTSAHPIPIPPLLLADRREPGLMVDIEASSPGQPVVERSETGLTDGVVPQAARTPLPSTSARHRAPQSPTPLPLTPRRRRRGRLQDPSSPIQRRTRTQTQSDLARQAFVRSDCEWRAFQQETEREINRLRQLELPIQER